MLLLIQQTKSRFRQFSTRHVIWSISISSSKSNLVFKYTFCIMRLYILREVTYNSKTICLHEKWIGSCFYLILNNTHIFLIIGRKRKKLCWQLYFETKFLIAINGNHSKRLRKLIQKLNIPNVRGDDTAVVSSSDYSGD